MDVAKMSGSAAAIALGYRKLEPEVKLAGVVLNNVGSPSHLRWVSEAVEKRAGVPVLGYLPKKDEICLPERQGIAVCWLGQLPPPFPAGVHVGSGR